jgi:hypothetical protein
VPEETLASSDKEVELDMAAGNISVKKKTPKKEKPRSDTTLFCFV